MLALATCLEEKKYIGSFTEQQKEADMRVITCHLKYVFFIYISALHVHVSTSMEKFTLGLP